MTDMSEEQIKKIIDTYKKQRVKDKDRYETLKLNEDFKVKNRERARLHYVNNKEKKKQKYQDNKDILNAKSLLQYYKYNDKVDTFKDKHKDKYDLLHNSGIIV